MSKSVLLTYVLTLALFNARSQNALPEFGKIDMADMQMKECAFDKSANAMVLFNDAKVTFETGMYGYTEVVTERRVRIKIFNENGFPAANISIPYINRSKLSKIRDVAACIYNLDDNGNITVQKLDKDQVFKDKSKVKYSGANIRFTFPNLKKGSVIEYRYTKSRKYSLSIPGWVFQDDIPTLYSNYSIKLPGYLNVYHRVIGGMPVQEDSVIKKYAQSRFNESTRIFTMRNIPAFKDEPLMSPAADNIQRILFLLTTSEVPDTRAANYKWQALNGNLIADENFGKQFDVFISGTTPFLDSVKALTTTHEKISSIFSYVKNNITWDGEQTIYADDITDCWNTKTGSSAEMNILLLNLLRKAGITCYPLLVSTRENGKPEMSFPSLGQFDGVDILTFDEKNNMYLLDCTQSKLSYKTAPFNILNRMAFLVDLVEGKWIDVSIDKPLFTTSVNVNALIDSTGNVNGNAYMELTNIAKVQELETDTKNKVSLLASSGDNDIKVDSTVKLHDKDDNDTLIKKVQFHYALSNAGNLYFINPSYSFSEFTFPPVLLPAPIVNLSVIP